MGQPDGVDPDVTPTNPARPRVPAAETQPLHIREATEPPVYPDEPVVGVDPTTRIPTQPVAPAAPVRPPAAVPVATAPVDPAYERLRHLEEQRRGAAVVFAAVLGLLVGGVIGFFIGRAVAEDDQDVLVSPTPGSTVPANADINTTLELLLQRTRADGEYRTPSEYPQLDEIVTIDRAAATAELQEQVALLTAAQDDEGVLTARVAELETALATVTAERDSLAAQQNGATDDGASQAELDAANAQIQTLEAELATARTDLETARTDLATATANAEAAQTELDAANAQLAELNVIPAPDYRNGSIDQAQADANANGWTLITESVPTDEPAGTVIDQAPPANSNMITGSVLYVKVASAPTGPGGG